MTRIVLAALALSTFGGLIAPPAQAVIYGGNPHITFTADRLEADLDEGDVTIEKVRMHYCGGGYTDITVDEQVDLVAGWGLDFAPGNYCAVKLFWDTDLLLDGTDTNNNAFTISHDAAFTHIGLTTGSSTVALSQVDWIVGVIYGGNPHITSVVTE